MDEIKFYLSLGAVMFLILSLSFRLGSSLCKYQNQKKVWSRLDLVAGFIAMVMALSGLFITVMS